MKKKSNSSNYLQYPGDISIFGIQYFLCRSYIKVDTQYITGADSGLVKLVVMTKTFFNYQQHEIEIKRIMCIKMAGLVELKLAFKE